MQVGDMNAAVETMHSLGVDPWGYEAEATEASGDEPLAERHESDDTEAVAYIHPRSGGAGFLFQLYAGGPWHLPDPFDDERSDSLGITAVNAIGHAHHSRQELGDWYEQLFGFQTAHRSSIDEDGTSFSTRVLESSSGQLRIEVMQPTREDSFLQRFLDRRGPAAHHVSFEVRDMERAMRACHRNGVRVLGARAGETDETTWQEAFLAPEHTGGLLVQLFSWEARRAAPRPLPPVEG
jgi:methylmalonyl-CoA/ethylmalonyl-CoA epimerase